MPTQLIHTLEQRLNACWNLGRSGQSTEGLVEAQRLMIEARRANDPERVAHANRCIGWFCLQLGHADEGLEAAGEASNYYSGTEDLWGQGLSVAVYSWLLLELGLSDLSFESASQATVIAGHTDDHALNAFALNCKALALTACQEHQLAVPLLGDAVALAERSGDPSTIALSLVNTAYSMIMHGYVLEATGDGDASQVIFRDAMVINDRAIDVARQAGDLWNLRTGLGNGAEVFAALGDTDRAHRYLEESRQLPGKVGPRERIHYLYSKGDLYHHLGEYDEALKVYEEANRLANNTSRLDHKVSTLRRLSEVKAKLGHYEEALSLHRAFHDAYVSQGGEVSRRRARAMDIQLENEKLREKAAEFEMQAGQDALTGVPNRRAFDAAFASIANGPAVVGILDVDHFKLVNDRYSHLVGDEVLARIAGVVNCTDPGMRIYRIGGEEFALIFAGMSLEQAEPLANKALMRIREIDLSDVADGLQVTASIGLAEAGILLGSQLLAEADRRLYVAKKRGRNMVIADSRSSIAAAAG